MQRKIVIMIVAVFFAAFSTGVSHAGDETLWTTTITPDAVIVQDLTGSMAWLPHGSNPTFYACSSSCNEPFYVTPQPNPVPSTLYVASSSCSSDGPYTVTDPDLAGMPTSPLYYRTGNACGSYDGPYTVSKPSNSFDYTTVWISSSSSCTSTSSSLAFYASTGTGHTKSCTVSSSALSGNPVYASNCSTGPFYRRSGTGHTTVCYKYSTCTLANGYTESDCATGPFYVTYGTGHTTACGTSTACTTPSTVYANDCVTGPYYKTSGSGHTNACGACNYSCSVSGSSYKYSDTSSCSGPFYNDSGSGTRTDCSKIAIAKRALFQLMDYDASGAITSTDVTGLGMRLGLIRYYNCSGEDNYTGTTPLVDKPWTAGCEKLIWSMTQSDNTTVTPYANLYCNDSTCASTVTSCTVTSPTKECIAGFSVTGGTPLADSIKEAKLFLDYHKTIDSSSTCRQKSIIVVTDGADTFSCGGSGSSTGVSQRRSPVYYAKKAADAGYKVYVVGFGAAMSDDEKNTLNWAAYYGGTRNPNETQSGDTTAVTVGTNPCSNGTDPAGHPLSGYAFMASNPEELVSSLRSAITSIQEATYSFSAQASVAAARVETENFIYEASFEPKNDIGTLKEPFWTGHLKKYQIGQEGQLITPHCWDAGMVLYNTPAANRSMWTSKANNSVTEFKTSNMTDADFGSTGTTCGTLCTSVVGFYRGESTYNLENWKLGDLFHTNPAAVKTPAQYFYDPRQCYGTAFTAYRTANTRTAANGNQLMLVGANDAQLHAFRTGSGSDCTGGGDELWSFIPPNLLQKMAPIAHSSHADRASLASHAFFIDGPIQVADVWMPGTAGSGTSKSSSDWHTIAIFGEGQGSGNYLWSSQSSCYSNSTSGYSATYDATNYPYYCGYWALDVTNTSATYPTLLGHLQPDPDEAPYLGEAWSKAQIGRVRDGNNEKWVAFIGGGYSAATCLSDDGLTSTVCNTPATGSSGKGFFVIDLSAGGTILWSYTHADNTTMDFSIPASPLPIDTDQDGFIDTVYVGDMGGNIWRFRLCPKDTVADCNACGKADYTSSPCTYCYHTSWTGSKLFASSNTERGYSLSTPSNSHKQIFTSLVSAMDDNHNILVFFGTGQNNDPTWRPTAAIPDTNDTKNRLYMVRENSTFTGSYTSSDLTNITSSIYDYEGSSNHGWYINLATNPVIRADLTVISDPTGEKMISDPTVFNKYVYFPTYIPDQGTTNACGLSGDSFIYILYYLTGAGVANNGTKKTSSTNADGQTVETTVTTYTDPYTGVTTVTTTVTVGGSSTTTTTTTDTVRSKALGHGIGSSILVSYRPNYTAADIYATASGGAGTAALTQDVGQAPKTSSMTNILYWKDRRLQ